MLIDVNVDVDVDADVDVDVDVEDLTQEGPAQDQSRSTFSQPDYLQPSTALSQSTYHFPTGLWRRVHTRWNESWPEQHSTVYILVSASVSTVLQSPCVHFTHIFSTRDRCTHALLGSSFAMIKKCQTPSSHVRIFVVVVEWLHYSKRIIIDKRADLIDFSSILVGKMCVLFHVQ